MKRILALLLGIIMLVSIVACAPAADAPAPAPAPDAPAADAPADAPAPDAPADAPVDTGPQVWALQDEVDFASTANAMDEYFDNFENYKDFQADGVLRVVYICKFLTSIWFAPKHEAMQQRAEELGIEYIGIDANSSEDMFMQGVTTAITMDADFVVLTPVNTAMLPAIVDLLKEAGIAYMTTDDGGLDSNGLRVPHQGLDSYWLCHPVGVAMGEEAISRGWDVSKLKIAMLCAPAVESIRHRSIGAYAGLLETIPGLTDDNFIWLDTIDNLTDNNIAKLSGAFQAHTADTDYWMVFCGGNNVWEAAFPIFDEAGLDFNNIVLGGLAMDASVADAMSESEAKGRSIFAAGILSAPSGVELINMAYDLYTNGTRLPNFSGYPEWLVYQANVDEYVAAFLASTQ